MLMEWSFVLLCVHSISIGRLSSTSWLYFVVFWLRWRIGLMCTYHAIFCIIVDRNVMVKKKSKKGLAKKARNIHLGVEGLPTTGTGGDDAGHGNVLSNEEASQA